MRIALTTPEKPQFGASAVPLFHAAWLFAAGIVVAARVWIQPSVILIALALICVVCMLAALRAQRLIWLPVVALWILLGAWCAEMEPHPAPSPVLASLSDGLLRAVEGTVVDTSPLRTELDQAADGQSMAPLAQRIDIRVLSVEVVNDASDAQEPVSGEVRLTVRASVGEEPQPIPCGERVRADVRLLPPEVYHDPDVWSRAEYLYDQGITSTAAVPISGIERLGPAPGAFWPCRISAWQHASTQRLLALPAAMHGLPAPLRLTQNDAVMLAAMVAGDRTYLTHALRVGFERTGSFHMLVVSGLHLAIVAAFLFWLFKRMHLPRVPATILTLAASFAYALFTGFATPVQRSFWMVALYLIGRLIYRERSPLNTIGFAALCLLVVSPRSLFDSSLQMTLLAVVAVAGVAVPLLAGSIHPYAAAMRDLKLVVIDIKLPPQLAQFRVAMRMIGERLDRASNSAIAWRAFPWTIRLIIRFIELVAISCVIELAMTLPMALYFHRITFFALPVNLLILPLLALLVPAALLTLLLLAVMPTVALAPAILVATSLHLGIGFVSFFGSTALGDLRIPGPLLWQSVAFCTFLGVAIAFARIGLSRMSSSLRHGAWIMLFLAACLVLLPRPVDRPRNALLVEAIDVGQGDSLLIVTPGGKTLLIDAGGFGGSSQQAPQDFDIGEDVVSPVLWARGIRHLDAVALSHAHSDHMGGMPAILRNFHPDELWVGNNPQVPAYMALLDDAAALRTRVRIFRAGDAFQFDQTQIRILTPFPDYVPGAEPDNNDSMVMRIAYGATSVLLEGDAEEPIEDEMLAEPGIASTLLKIGHHGSITSTRPEFLARVAPRWAVISCGLHNRYGHPREEVLQELQRAHVRTYQTYANGITCFQLDGKTVKTEVGCGER